MNFIVFFKAPENQNFQYYLLLDIIRYPINIYIYIYIDILDIRSNLLRKIGWEFNRFCPDSFIYCNMMPPQLNQYQEHTEHLYVKYPKHLKRNNILSLSLLARLSLSVAFVCVMMVDISF